ncbi:MAG: ABC transporter ATP-binding protein [Chloroflexota bacterium]
MTAAEFTLAAHATRRPTNRRGPVRWIVSHGLRYWYFFVAMCGGALANALLMSLTPIFIGQAFNAILASPPRTDELLRLALWIAGTQLLRGFMHLTRAYGAELMAQAVERNVREELYVSLLGKSMTFHNLQPVGDTMARATNDVREVNFLFSPGINLVVGSLNFLFMPLLIAPRYHPSLVIVPILFIAAYFVALWQYLHELGPITGAVRGLFGVMNTRLAEALDGIETVKGMAQEGAENARFRQNAAGYRDAMIRQGNVEARFMPMLLLALAQVFGLLHALLLYRQGLLDLGGVVGYFGILQLFDFPTWTSLWAYSQISLGVSAARRILELMNREDNLDQNAAGYSGPMRGQVEFRGVEFRYGDNDAALENISFQVQPGQTVAVVGQTGAGKTSLARLINRTYDTSQGQVLVDGVDVRDWNLEALRRGIAIIEQDIFLFSRTIAENIAFGRPDATQAEIEAAARAAQAHEFILSFQDGYQTVIGERGVTLSGGQRQRLALARSFLTNPPILILDDSTSSIDSETEDKIQRAIFTAARGRTTFIITHRLSQIRWADLILVIRQGKLAAVGNHETLLETSDAYRNIFTEK